ncbi:hypothetical protein [Rhodococcus gordoniae]|uniref:hypothetical protein n=1 Tax=Rhodococcus gordoniae TaxID=223392 RepID=UPI0020CC3E3B|nr:hypothetical protein [Rhodococcus gordoniae]UTT48928.1 hypothetical protein NMQ04_01545 [Rhodococcus gordoniae]
MAYVVAHKNRKAEHERFERQMEEQRNNLTEQLKTQREVSRADLTAERQKALRAELVAAYSGLLHAANDSFMLAVESAETVAAKGDSDADLDARNRANQDRMAQLSGLVRLIGDDRISDLMLTLAAELSAVKPTSRSRVSPTIDPALERAENLMHVIREVMKDHLASVTTRDA